MAARCSEWAHLTAILNEAGLRFGHLGAYSVNPHLLMQSERAPDPVAETMSWRWTAFALLALVLGAVLRLSWGQDIEFKYDEAYMFEQAINAGLREPFPWVGMSSGAGVVNPGLSAWLFIAMARVFDVQTPPELARVVQCTNVVALGLAMVFGFRTLIVRRERESWIWAIALGCVNPFAVLFGRKIWAQSVLPLFCLLTIAGWWKRGNRWGAFAWGLGGAWLGQIHMSGFFFAGSLMIWTLLNDWTAPPGTDRSKIHWRAWAAGSLIGALGLLPWMWQLLTHGSSARDHEFLAVLAGHNTFGLWYWILWVTGALGLGMSYSLGVTEFTAFLRYPVLEGRSTYLVAVAHLVLLGLGAWLLLTRAWPVRLRTIQWRRAILGGDEPTDRLVKAALYGSGLLLTLAGYPVHRHYLIVTFPLEWLWLARQMRIASSHWNYLLSVIWIAQLIISAGFLYYIHVNHGAATGDYGISYMHRR